MSATSRRASSARACRLSIFSSSFAASASCCFSSTMSCCRPLITASELRCWSPSMALLSFNDLFSALSRSVSSVSVVVSGVPARSSSCCVRRLISACSPSTIPGCISLTFILLSRLLFSRSNCSRSASRRATCSSRSRTRSVSARRRRSELSCCSLIELRCCSRLCTSLLSFSISLFTASWRACMSISALRRASSASPSRYAFNESSRAL